MALVQEVFIVPLALLIHYHVLLELIQTIKVLIQYLHARVAQVAITVQELDFLHLKANVMQAIIVQKAQSQ
jgi:hypothetical protein